MGRLLLAPLGRASGCSPYCSAMRWYGAMRKSALLLRVSPAPVPAPEGYLVTGRYAGLWSRLLSSSPSRGAPPSTTATTAAAFISTSSRHHLLRPPPDPSPLRSIAPLSTATGGRGETDDEEESEEWNSGWEEEEEVEPVIGDGGDGGGIVLGDVAWGERTLSAAREVLLQFDDDLVMYAFKASPRGYIYVRLDKLTHQYGCPSMEEIAKFNNMYKTKLDEIRESGEITVDLAIEISSPGAERLLKVPEDLDRFKDMPMRVQYMDEGDGSSKPLQQREKVFMLDLIDTETKCCVWKLADVRENKADLKGRPLSRKQKDWRLRLPFAATKRAMLYLDSK